MAQRIPPQVPSAQTLHFPPTSTHPLQGRLEHAVDEEGRLFVDRDPELFAVLLQFMRQLMLKNCTTCFCPWSTP